MPYKYERLYKFPTTIDFVLYETDGIDVNATASCVLGDVVIMQSEGASANATNLFSAQAVGHSLVLTSAEMAAARISIKVADQATKEWLDEVIIIETYGNENSQHNRRNSGVILETTITSVSGNAEFIITDKPDDNNTLLNSVAMIIDNSSPGGPPDRSFRNVTSYSGSTGRVELARDTDFTIAAGDTVVFLPTADVDSADDIASAVWDVVRTNHQTAGTFGHGVNINAYTSSGKAETSSIFVSALKEQQILDTDDLPTNFGSLSITGGGEVTVGENNDKTDYTLAAGQASALSEVMLTFSWSAISTSAGGRSMLNALRFLRNRWNVTGSTLSVYKENDTTIAWQSDLSSVASANAVIDSNPA